MTTPIPHAALLEAFEEVRRQFVYRPDGWFDRWRVMRPQGSPPQLVGDCEDFSLTVLAKVYGGTWPMIRALIFSGKATLWHVETPDGGHAVGELETDLGRFRFDNVSPVVRSAEGFVSSRPHYVWRYRTSPLRLLVKMFPLGIFAAGVIFAAALAAAISFGGLPT
ncbi:hypothetical protein P2H44_22820 [Albimonas sp. CAU 1670]|uniref:hypothetical protein n=1 Tax=Albimonas sp. CAU 1670 TaxID=3032599 RepID=UPI0023DAF214|nr:hypothetical protein [Albimonas sp. CAU 1670]MDF2235399.1 hypothetical protein [Albimonas sp. CAU 1670]